MSIENNTEIYLGKYINEMGHESIKFFIGLQLKVESLLLLVIIFLREESDSLNAEMLELMFWSKLYKNLVLRNLVKKMCTRCSGKFWRGK